MLKRAELTVLPRRAAPRRVARTLSLIWPFTSERPAIFGSCTKDWPDEAPGGSEPVMMYLRHSMMVVLPQPFSPTMTVSGLANLMSCASSGPKERMPRIDSASIDAMAGRRRAGREEEDEGDEVRYGERVGV